MQLQSQGSTVSQIIWFGNWDDGKATPIGAASGPHRQCYLLFRRSLRASSWSRTMSPSAALIPALPGRPFFLFLSANLVGCPANGLGGAWSLFGGVWRFHVAHPSGTSGLQARRDWVVPACRVAMESSLRCLYSSGPSPLTFKAPVPKLIYSLNSCFGPIFVNLEAPVSPGYDVSMQ